jgi:hypothetical protein
MSDSLQQFLDRARAQAEAFKKSRGEAPSCDAFVPEYDRAVSPRWRCVSVEVTPDIRLQIVPDCNKDVPLAHFIAHAANNGTQLAETLLKLVECVRCYEKALKAECACDPDGHSTCDACEARAEVGRILGGKG